MIKTSYPPLWAPQGTWARSNVENSQALAKHLADVFQPHPSESELQEEQYLNAPYQPGSPIKRSKISEVQDVISNINPKNYRVTISTLVRFLRNCLLLE
jgi:hypothetical protein